ncbi:MAG: hypothetical protein ACRDTE_14120 [Pseudonocardiaceae bacterium]
MNDQSHAPACPNSEMAVGLALHALEPDEEILVAAHLPDCAECARIVAETEQVGTTLGLSIPEMTPSPELEQRILAVTTTPQAAPVMSPPPRPATSLPHAPRRRTGQRPICWPDVLMLLSVVLLAMAVAAGIVFLLI